MATVPRGILAGAVRGARPLAAKAPADWLGQAASTVGRRGIQPYAGDYEPDKPWWAQALSPILEGPIGQALTALDLGRSAVVSTVKEGIDLVQGEGFSGSDWLDQVKSHYGFGDILRDENINLGKWGNRIVGFVGDVALDPVTYATFGTGALAKVGYKMVADQLMDASMRAGIKTAEKEALVKAARRVHSSGSKLAAGGKALRSIGYDAGFGFSMPGTGMFGRMVGMDKALDAITGGRIAARRAAEWAPAFQQVGAKFGMKAARSTQLYQEALNTSITKGRASARKLFDEEAELLSRQQMAAQTGGHLDRRATMELAEEISDELLGVFSQARRSRVDLFWRNGKVSTKAPEWTRTVEGLGGATVTGPMAGRGGFRFGDRDNVIIKMLSYAPGKAFQGAVRSTIGKNLTTKIGRAAARNQWITDQITSGDPVGYWAGRALETGDHIGFANRGRYHEIMDRLQNEMLNAAHRGGFDIWGVELGGVSALVPGAAPTSGMNARRAASRILYEASAEPWEYADGTLNPNLDDFREFVKKKGDGTITPEELHKNLRKFWDTATTEWEGIANRSLREVLDENERYVTRTMSQVAREAAGGEGWYKAMDDAPRVGERPKPGESLGPTGLAGRAVRDIAYTTKERIFVPGKVFTWQGSRFRILKPGTAGKVGTRDYTHAPSVQRQIENFVAEVDPKRFNAKDGSTFFDTDYAKVLDRYKQAQGRELIWAGIEDHLVAKGIFVEAKTLADGNALLDDISVGVRNNRTSLNKLKKPAKNAAEGRMNAAARARRAMEEGDDLTERAARVQAEGTPESRQAVEDLFELDARIAAIQRSLMNVSDEVQEGIVKGADGKFRTAPQAGRAMEDLLEMAVGLEATARLARMLRTVGQGIEAQGQAQQVSAWAAKYPDLASEVQRLPSLNKAYEDILFQLKVAQDMLQVVKNQAAKLGGLDKTVRDAEALIDGLLGKSRYGLARKDAPKYIQNYVDQVHEVGRLADELDAGLTFNAGYRKPLFPSRRMTPEQIEAGRLQLYNRTWVEKTRRLLREQLEADAAAVREGQALADDAGVFSTVTERVPLLEAEAERLTALNVRREAQEEVISLNNEAQAAYVQAAREIGLDPTADPLRTKSFMQWRATALDIESQRAAFEARLLNEGMADARIGYEGGVKFGGRENPLNEILEDDIGKFQQAENIFKGLLQGRQGAKTEDQIQALIAGFQDGMLPFGPVYAEGGGQMFQAVLGSRAANEGFLDLMRDTMNVGQGEVGAFLKAWDSMTGLFKAQAVARPAFIQRNGLGGMFNNLLAGMDMANAYRFLKLRGRAIKEGWQDALREAGLPDDLGRGHADFLRSKPGYLKRRAAEIGAEKLAAQGDSGMRDLRRVYRSGAIGAGQAASEVAQSFRLGGATTLDRYGRPLRWNPLRRDNVWNTAIRNGNMEMEEILRGSLALDSVRGGLDDAAIVARVTRYHFNYSKDAMTDFERQVLSRAYPFYTWTRNSIPLMATEMLRNPKPFLRYLQLKQNLELGVEKDRNVPAWYGERWGIDMSALLGNPNQGARAWAFPDLPFMDLVEATSGGPDILFGLDPATFASGLAPQIKTPIEMLTGTSLFQQIPIRSEYIKPPLPFDMPGLLPFLEKLPGDMVAKNSRGEYGIRESAAYALQNFLPYLAQFRRLVPREDRYKAKTTAAWLSWSMPVGFRDPGTVRYETRGAVRGRRRDRGLDRADRASLERIR